MCTHGICLQCSSNTCRFINRALVSILSPHNQFMGSSAVPLRFKVLFLKISPYFIIGNYECLNSHLHPISKECKLSEFNFIAENYGAIIHEFVHLPLDWATCARSSECQWIVRTVLKSGVKSFYDVPN